MVQGKDSQVAHGDMCGSHCISWKAIFAGALVGLGLSFLLTLFGFAIGLTAFTTSKEGLVTLAIGGFIGMLIGAIATMYTAGWVAGYLSRPYCMNRQMGALYGFAAWVVVLIISVLMASQIASFIAFNYNAIANPKTMEMRLTANPESFGVEQTPTKNNKTSQVNVNTEKAANTAGVSLLLTFVLFLVGALSSCFGGYFGHKSAVYPKSSRS